MTRVEALERAAVAAGRHEWSAVLQWLTEAWTAQKHPELVELAWALVSHRLSAEPIAAAKERDTEDAWHAAKEQNEVLRLVSTPWPRLTGDARARVAAIVEGEPGLLWTAALAALIRADPYRSNQGYLMMRLALRWLVKEGDPMAARLVEELRAAGPELVRIDLGALSRRELPRAAALSDREKALVEQVRSATATRAVDVAALFREVYEHPRDDGRRAVLADVLTELGDPRGEFIALQLSPHPRHARRVNELLRAHGAEWLKPLSPFIVVPSRGGSIFTADVPTFSRGFPSNARLLEGQSAEIFGRTEAWSTIERLKLGGAFAFEFHPHLRALDVLLGVRDGGTTLIPPLERAVIFVDAPLARLPFQAVRELGLVAGWNDRARVEEALDFFSARAAWFSTVERLQVPGTGRDLAFARSLLQRFPGVQQVSCSLEVTGGNVSFPSNWELALSRARVMTLTWHGRNWSGDPPAAVSTWLAPSHVAGLEQVIVDQALKLTPAQRRSVEAALREVADDWPEGVALTLFGEDGRA